MTTTQHSAAAYREAVTKYRTQLDVMKWQQEQARANGERARAERYQLGIDAMDAAAAKHQALAERAEMEEPSDV